MKTKTYCICEMCDGEIRDNVSSLQYKGIQVKEENGVSAIGRNTIDLRIAFKIRAGYYHVGCLVYELFGEPGL